MAEDRTEQAALSGLLTLAVGADRVAIRVLSIEQSEAWQARFSASIAGIEVPTHDEGGPSALFAGMLRQGPTAMLDLLLAYDLEGALGTREEVRGRMTQPQLRAALDAILEVESPLGPGERHSVVGVFGLATRLMAEGMAVTMGSLAASGPGSSTSSPSPSGASTPALSVLGSRTSSSSSSGHTARSASSGRRRTG